MTGMRILFVADGRSPIAANWIDYFLYRNYEVHLVSTFSCQKDGRLASLNFVPVAFSGIKSGSAQRASTGQRNAIWGGGTVQLRTMLRQWFGVLTLNGASKRLSTILKEIDPDLVHAMRIPYEGMLAALAAPQAQLLISVWGNDFTLHAQATPLMGRFTRKALAHADALHTDCQRDARLAQTWGFKASKPSIVLPGGGGVQLDQFYPPKSSACPERELTVINPRGMRAYVCNKEFFQAIPLVLERKSGVRFICPGMADEPQAQSWVRQYGLDDHVELLPKQDRDQMAELFRHARVAVSPTQHDGTPNSLLEAMASGCFPVAGDLESLREWIDDGVNGILVNPSHPEALAGAIVAGLQDDELCRKANSINLGLIRERADYQKVMPEVENFFYKLVGNSTK